MKLSIGFGILQDPRLFSDWLKGRQVCIVTHPSIATHYLEPMQSVCRASGSSEVHSFLVPEGETSKTLEMSQEIWTFLLENHFNRDACLIALGGGVIGDLTGFCAACYKRGIDVIQCPTTLLAQIDASIGGKTAINHALGKNVLGAFHSPVAVMIDISTLNTLPERELRSAISELIKYAMIADAAFFTWLQNNVDTLLERQPNGLLYAVEKASALKISIVSEDERDKGKRAILNFGHTVGHAIESLLEYKWSHGEAVALGLIVATHLSWQQQRVEKEVVDSLITLLNYVKLPIQLPKGITVSSILAKIKQDKKHAHGKLRWVLLKGVGEADVNCAVTSEQITQALLFCGAT